MVQRLARRGGIQSCPRSRATLGLKRRPMLLFHRRKDVKSTPHGEHCTHLSILVVLDHVPRPRRPRPQPTRPISFDPCSPGSRSSTPVVLRVPVSGSVVSILVLLDHAPRLPESGHDRQSSPRFRSLFSWITLLDTWASAGRCLISTSFDPFSPGSRSSTRLGQRVHGV